MRSQSLKIRDVAVHEPVTARPTDSIGTCARRMHDEHVGCLVIVEDNDGEEFPVGILTDRDIAIEVVAFGLDPATMTAAT
jgi:CBS domain-containing protein